MVVLRESGPFLPFVVALGLQCTQCLTAQQTSPFRAPDENERTFVVSSGAGLDTGCTFRSGGPLRITLPIKRVIGSVPLLRSNGLIPERVRIEFPAYDVDSDGGPPPERDRVSVNGNVVPGDFLTGLDDTWIMQRFDIPFEWLRFPNDPGEGGTPTPAANEIRIDIDTASGSAEYWCTAVDWVAVTIDAPRPWIGAHGIRPPLQAPPSNAIWSAWWVPQLNALGIPASNGPEMGHGLLGALDSIENNAGKIRDALGAAKQRWGVQRVNIMAHSKGGIDARHYILGTDSVERLIQLGTPNKGSPIADIAQGIAARTVSPLVRFIVNAFAAPAGIQLTQPYMIIYNYFHGRNPRTTYTAIAGDYTPGTLFNDTWAKILSQIVGKGDTIVPLSSVHALSYATNLTVSSAYPTSGAKHTSIHSFPAAYNLVLPQIRAYGALRAPAPADSSDLVTGREWLGPLSARPAPASDEPQVAAQPTTAQAGLGLQRTRTAVGSISQGQTQTHIIPVDSATTTAFVLLHPTGNLDMVLTDPTGAVFNPSTIQGKPNVARQEVEILGGFAEIYAFNGSVATGNWSVQILAPSASGSVDYAVSAWLEGAPLTFETAVLNPSVPLGSPLGLRGAVRNAGAPVAGATVQARLIAPDGVTVSAVSLLDNGTGPDSTAGDGIYNGSFTGTLQAGNYGVTFSATGSIGLQPFSRETFDLASVSLSSSSIQPGITDFGRDTNGNGLFEQLVIRVPVNVTALGTYRLAGTLTDPIGNTQEASLSFNLSPGLREVELPFDGATIFARGVNGPYLLSALRLAEEHGLYLVPLQERINAHVTAAYSFSQFEGSQLALTGTGTATGIDTNANGKFDVLQIDLGLNARNAGFYEWSGRLRDRNGREIGLASGSGNLPVGISSIRLSFPGNNIGQNGVDGPYDVTDVLVFGVSQSLSVANAFRTQVFRASDFEGYVASVGPPRISGAVSNAVSVSPGVMRMDLTLTNSGTGTGRNIFIRQLTFRTLAGDLGKNVTLNSPALPISVGDLSPGASRTIQVTLNVPSGISRFSITESGTVVDTSGNTLSFSIGQAVLVR